MLKYITGIPGEVRSQCWKLLLGYLPANSDRREVTLARKRKEYHDCVDQYYGILFIFILLLYISKLFIEKVVNKCL